MRPRRFLVPLAPVLAGGLSNSASEGAAQAEEQIEIIETRFRWRSTGTVWSDAQVDAWRDRFEILQYSDTKLCNETKAGVSAVLTPGQAHTLGWAQSSIVYGTHFAGGPFEEDDHWIVLQPEEPGHDENGVLKNLDPRSDSSSNQRWAWLAGMGGTQQMFRH